MCARGRCTNIGLAQHDIINSWAASGPSEWMYVDWWVVGGVCGRGGLPIYVCGCSGGNRRDER